MNDRELRPGGVLKRFAVIAISLMACALVATGMASGHQPKHPPVATLSLQQREAWQEHALHHYRSVVHAWLKYSHGRRTQNVHGYPRCKATNVRMPTRICWHAYAARWTSKELEETRAQIRDRSFQHLVLNDWVSAVRYVQRVYPGTEAWLLSCSAHEGGHGGWVSNHEGSGASGWMQFMFSTYDAHDDEAIADARAHGLIVPDLGSSGSGWHSPLGQAVTAAYLRFHGQSSHWDPGIDPYCR